MTGFWKPIKALKVKNTGKYLKSSSLSKAGNILSKGSKLSKNSSYPLSKEANEAGLNIKDKLCDGNFDEAFSIAKRSKSSKLLSKGLVDHDEEIDTSVFGKGSGFFGVFTDPHNNTGGGGAKFDGDPMLDRECYSAALRGFLTEVMLSYAESKGLSSAAGIDDIARYIPPGPLCEQFGANVAKAVIQRSIKKNELLPAPEDMKNKEYFMKKIAEFKANLNYTRYIKQVGLL